MVTRSSKGTDVLILGIYATGVATQLSLTSRCKITVRYKSWMKRRWRNGYARLYNVDPVINLRVQKCSCGNVVS